jgi:hypothetical protein
MHPYDTCYKTHLYMDIDPFPHKKGGIDPHYELQQLVNMIKIIYVDATMFNLQLNI